MIKVSSPILSTITFVLSLLSYVGLQFAPHADPTAIHSLYMIMGLALGHTLGTSAAQGTVANITIPGNTTTTTTGSSNG